MGSLARVLWFCGGLAAASVPSFAVADDWQVTRSEFDPRVIAPMKAELRRKPEDLSHLRRLMGLYKRNSTLDKLAAELLSQAEKSNAGADYFLVAQFERERGRLDEAAKLLQLAEKREGGPDP